jgi:four helix bundle protein
MIFSFEKLEVWQEARKFYGIAHQVIPEFPSQEKYVLSNQLQRAALSVSSNIAEGTSRITGPDQAHFSNIAFSSLMECLNYLILAKDLNYLTLQRYEEMRVMIEKISNQLNALRKFQSKRNFG